MTIEEITESLSKALDLKLVTSAYGDIAGLKLVDIRVEIERNRLYASELASVYHIIREAAQNKKITSGSKKKGTLNLLLTSNHRFYGGLETRLADFFIAHSTLSLGNLLVVGTFGQTYLKEAKFGSFDSLTFKTDVPNSSELTSLLEAVAPFEHVLVYYSKMQTVILQHPVIVELGGVAEVALKVENANYYLFEPELVGMLFFFETQIARTVLSQAFLESELARTAARLVSMEEAQRKAGDIFKSLQTLLVRSKINLADSQMQDIILSARQAIMDKKLGP